MSCLAKIADEIDLDIIVVDNRSLDYDINNAFATRFPNFKFIQNKKNLGFAEANNIGVGLAKSDNLLFLNPDTIVSIEVVKEALERLHISQVGAVAVKMCDGAGEFLPESKRGFPNLSSSFFKLIGLHKLFPKSRIFNQYYLGKVLNPDFIEVLSGACFFIRKNTFCEIGGWDSSYFMYGEDIDLSYQLSLYNYKINYISDKNIIHFKGKSSSKTNWKYQTAFFNAMEIYWKKNNSNQDNLLNRSLIHCFIFGLKLFSFLKHIAIALIVPLIDMLILFSLNFLISIYWANCIKGDSSFFPSSYFLIVLPFYTLLWVFAFFISKVYDQKIFELNRLFSASVIGTIFMLITYFLLPSDFKFSRAILLLSIILSFLVPLGIRLILSFLFHTQIRISSGIIFSSHFIPEFESLEKFSTFLRKYSKYKLVQKTDLKDHLVIDIHSNSNQNIINTITNKLPNQEIWLYSEDSEYLIQSLGKKETEYIISKETNFNIALLSQRFLKRTFDILIAFGLLFFLVLKLIFSYRSAIEWARYAMDVIGNRKTWVSIQNKELRKKYRLKEGVFLFDPTDNVELDQEYLRNYDVFKELSIFFSKMFKS